MAGDISLPRAAHLPTKLREHRGSARGANPTRRETHRTRTVGRYAFNAPRSRHLPSYARAGTPSFAERGERNLRHQSVRLRFLYFVHVPRRSRPRTDQPAGLVQFQSTNAHTRIFVRSRNSQTVARDLDMFKAMKVLVADDSETVRNALRLLLEQQGYEVVLASDGKQAWDALVKGDLRLA